MFTSASNYEKWASDWGSSRLLHLFESLIQASCAGIHHAQPYVTGRPLGFLPQGLQKLCLGFRDFTFENMQSLRAIGAKIRCQSA